MIGFLIFIGIFNLICGLFIWRAVAASRWWKSVSVVYKELDGYKGDGNVWLKKWSEAEDYYRRRPWYM